MWYSTSANGRSRQFAGWGHRTLAWTTAPTASAEGRLRTLKDIHAPPSTISAAPTSTVGGVLAGPIVAAYIEKIEQQFTEEMAAVKAKYGDEDEPTFAEISPEVWAEAFDNAKDQRIIDVTKHLNEM
jgi:hypothetical protein